MLFPIHCYSIVDLYSSLHRLMTFESSMFFETFSKGKIQQKDPFASISTNWRTQIEEITENSLVWWVFPLCVFEAKRVKWKIASHSGGNKHPFCIQFVWRMSHVLFSLHIFNVSLPIFTQESDFTAFAYLQVWLHYLFPIAFQYAENSEINDFSCANITLIEQMSSTFCCLCNQTNRVMSAAIQPRSAALFAHNSFQVHHRNFEFSCLIWAWIYAI